MDRLGAILGPLGTVLGPLGAILGPQGACWGPLGAALGPLGRVAGGYVGTTSFLIIFWFDSGPIWRPKWVPKGAQNGAQNAPKSNTKIMIRYEGFLVPLGSVLGPSWVILGSILGSKIIEFHWFYSGFVNIAFLKKIRLQSASWTDLGSILAPKGVPKSSQIGPKMEPKWYRKTIKK